MSRSLVFLRDAEATDAERLADLWADLVRRGEQADRVADMVTIIESAAADPDQRLVVAEYDGVVAGGVHLRLATVTPFNLDLALQVMSPYVFPEYRRHGVGHALMDAAATWADERGAGHIATAVSTSSRDANRFMARLALGPIATLRLAPATVVRAKLATQGPPVPRPARQLTHVLAVRRSMRRQESQADLAEQF